jgi:hypothetical protein
VGSFLESRLGMPLWPTYDAKLPESAWLAFDAELCERIRMIFISSDGGSDMIKMRRHAKAETEFDIATLMVDFSCTQHGGALIVKGNLIIIDAWLAKLRKLRPKFDAGFKGYYSAIAKVLHVWRDNVKNMYKLALKTFDPMTAKDHFKRYPPKCMSSRWGCLTDCEAYVKTVTRGRLEPLIKVMCMKKSELEAAHTSGLLALEPEEPQPRAAPAAIAAEPMAELPEEDAAPAPGPAPASKEAPPQPATALVDDPRVEETEAYKLKMTRWKRDTFSAISSGLFWQILDFSHKAGDPLGHHLRFVQKITPGADGRLGPLICKVGSLFSEFEAIFVSSSWASSIIHAYATDQDLASFVILLQVQLGMHSSAGYHRRVTSILCECLPQML